MRDMMATHERLEARSTQTHESVRKAAGALFEALPAILLAGALLMPALAALAARTADRPGEPAPGVELGNVIAAQGNQALAQIRAEQRAALLQNLALPKLPS